MGPAGHQFRTGADRAGGNVVDALDGQLPDHRPTGHWASGITDRQMLRVPDAAQWRRGNAAN
jgi:hypothetical protein